MVKRGENGEDEAGDERRWLGAVYAVWQLRRLNDEHQREKRCSVSD